MTRTFTPVFVLILEEKNMCSVQLTFFYTNFWWIFSNGDHCYVLGSQWSSAGTGLGSGGYPRPQ